MPRTNSLRVKTRPSYKHGRGVYETPQNKLAYYATRASYGSSEHEQRLFDQGYKLDDSLSKEREKVYYDPTGEMKPIVAFRGTQDFTDVGADIELGLGHYRGEQFKRAQALLDMSEARYGKGIVTGHSLGGTKAIVAGRHSGHEVVAFNPGTGLFPLEAGDSIVFNTDTDIINQRIRGSNIYGTTSGGHSSENFEHEFGKLPPKEWKDPEVVLDVPEVMAVPEVMDVPEPVDELYNEVVGETGEDTDYIKV